MTIDEILDRMDDLLDKATTVPFSNKKTLVDADKMRELIDSMRYNLPAEVKKAKELTESQSSIIGEANKKADEVVKRAEERAKLLIANDAIVKQARDAGNEIVAQAYKKDKEIMQALTTKVEKMLNEVEKTLKKNLTDITNTKSAFKMVTERKPAAPKASK